MAEQGGAERDTADAAASRLGQLLFPQVCLLAAVAGVVCLRHPEAGLLGLALLWLLDLPRSAAPGRLLLLALSFAAALGYAAWRTPLPPPVPDWLAEASAPARAVPDDGKPPLPVRIQGRVLSSILLSGGRQRVILEQPSLVALPGDAGQKKRPVGSGRQGNTLPGDAGQRAEAGGELAYQGNIAWTWYSWEQVLLPGQRVEVTARFAPVRGMDNPGLRDFSRYWADQNVWFRAWSGKRGKVVLIEGDRAGLLPERTTAVALARVRLDLLREFVRLLPDNKTRQAFISSLFRREASPQPGTRPLADKAGSASRLSGATSKAVQEADKGRDAPRVSGVADPLGGSLSGGAAVLPALVFGERSFLGRESSELLARSTLAHSLALSGLHLGYVVLAGWALAYVLGLCRPLLWHRLPRLQLALYLALPLTGLYLWLGRMPLSLLRAACMLFFWVLLLVRERPKIILDGLCAAVGVFLLVNPLAIFDLSLQLSVLSVVVIGLCLPGVDALSRRLVPDRPYVYGPVEDPTLVESLRNWVRDLPRNSLRGLVILLTMSLCIQTALLPLTLPAFGLAGLCFPLNALWLPVLGVLVMPAAFAGLLLSSLGLEVPARLALQLAALPCEELLALLRGLDASGLLVAPLMPRPHWLSGAGFWLLCLVVPGMFRIAARRPLPERTLLRPLFGGRRLGAALAALGLLLLLLPPALVLQADSRQGVRLRLVDVGQGQAVLVEWSGLEGQGGPLSGRALVDGGGFAGSDFDVGRNLLVPILSNEALPRLEAVIASHPDTDHLGGLVYLLEHASVGNYWTNGGRPTPALDRRERRALRRSGLARGVLKAGDVVPLGPGLCFEVLWPDASARPLAGLTGEEKGNNASLVLRLVWQGQPLALLCGDAEIPALQAMTRSGLSLRAQVLILPHHGAASALLPAFYEAVRPTAALASCGYANRWGFPSPRVRAALQALDIPLHSTAARGQIRVDWHAPTAAPELRFTRE